MKSQCNASPPQMYLHSSSPRAHARSRLDVLYRSQFSQRGLALVCERSAGEDPHAAAAQFDGGRATSYGDNVEAGEWACDGQRLTRTRMGDAVTERKSIGLQ
jgi:hypothetical protein